jgi:hypothetical protein
MSRLITDNEALIWASGHFLYKIRYKDTMTTYQLSASFNTREEAEEYINLNLGENSLYEVEVNDE